jgi:hypothetical protein
MDIMINVFGVLLVLAILLATLDWCFWGRSPKQRYQLSKAKASLGQNG